jgi:hypothetical protein
MEEKLADFDPNSPDAMGKIFEQLTKLNKLDGIQSDITKIKTKQDEFIDSLKFNSNEIDKLKTSNTKLTKELKKSDVRVYELEKRCNFLDLEVEKIKEDGIRNEAYRKRKNLVFVGVPEDDDKYLQGTLGSVGKILEDKMGIHNEDITVIDCYRLGPPPGKGNANHRKQGPRPCMINFGSIQDKKKVWDKKSKLKGEKVFIEEDYPAEVKRRRSTLYPIMKAAREIDTYKKCAYLQGENLIINKRKYSVKTIKDLPRDINPLHTSTKTVGTTTYFFTKDSPLSNHYPAAFAIGKDTYNCTEQRYFARKAQVLGDDERYREIMAAKEPHEILAAGKRVGNFTDEDWAKVEQHEMKLANRAKFSQNGELMKFLLSTGGNTLAEASLNGHWGVGVSLRNAGGDQSQEMGKNLMGECLMILRDEFRNTVPETPPAMETEETTSPSKETKV